MPRPSKYNPVIGKALCDHLKTGCTRKDAYGAVGIDAGTFANWLTRYSDFSYAVGVAEAEVANNMTRIVVKAATAGDWRAALEWLKRRRRDEWGDNLSLSRLSDEDVIALATGGVSGVNQAGDTAG